MANPKLVRQSDARCSLPHSTGFDDDFFYLNLDESGSEGAWLKSLDSTGTAAVGILRGGQVVMTTAATDNDAVTLGLQVPFGISADTDHVEAIARVKISITDEINAFFGFNEAGSGATNVMADDGAGVTGAGFGWYLIDAGDTVVTDWTLWSKPEAADTAQTGVVAASDTGWITLQIEGTRLTSSEFKVTGMIDHAGGQNLTNARSSTANPRSPDLVLSTSTAVSDDYYLCLEVKAGKAEAQVLTVDYVSVRQNR